MSTVEKARYRWYRSDQQNNDIAFRDLVASSITPESWVLDAGAGAGEMFHYDFKNRAARMAGVDLDPRVERNPQLHEGICASLTEIPFGDETFDVVFSRYVLEHIDPPQALLKEINRVLKPGGEFIFLTPNKWHYVGIGSRFSPHPIHVWYNKKRGRDEEDTFPTCYKLNSGQDIRREMARAGFREVDLIFREACPNYLTFSMPSFLLGVAYERLVNRFDFLKGIRCNIIGRFVKAG
ncbi:MAG: class I SAM-dependent methyltransferase [Candidatus Omnitrophica bacterium COP1]|nr:class I SAM-dependent methyltransferase [Candidatus Omnitrophica bacterium COP1]